MNDWFTTPADDGNGHTIIVTGRLDVDKFRSRERNNIRIEVTMPYQPAGPLGFPDEATAELLDQATEAMLAELKGKTTAIMTGIYTGASPRCPHYHSKYTPKTTPTGPNTTKCSTNVPPRHLSTTDVLSQHYLHCNCYFFSRFFTL